MEANELRIGNLVYANNVNEKIFVEHIISNPKDIDNALWYFGIPLTEEWLLKFRYRLSQLHYFCLGHSI